MTLTLLKPIYFTKNSLIIIRNNLSADSRAPVFIKLILSPSFEKYNSVFIICSCSFYISQVLTFWSVSFAEIFSCLKFRFNLDLCETNEVGNSVSGIKPLKPFLYSYRGLNCKFAFTSWAKVVPPSTITINIAICLIPIVFIKKLFYISWWQRYSGSVWFQLIIIILSRLINMIYISFYRLLLNHPLKRLAWFTPKNSKLQTHLPLWSNAIITT